MTTSRYAAHLYGAFGLNGGAGGLRLWRINRPHERIFNVFYCLDGVSVVQRRLRTYSSAYTHICMCITFCIGDIT